MWHRTVFVVVLACVLIAPTTPARATPGHLDRTFSSDGKVLTVQSSRSGYFSAWTALRVVSSTSCNEFVNLRAGDVGVVSAGTQARRVRAAMAGIVCRDRAAVGTKDHVSSACREHAIRDRNEVVDVHLFRDAGLGPQDLVHPPGAPWDAESTPCELPSWLHPTG